MNEHLHPGPHPDSDQLNAFIEGVLPEHERLECLAHFAACSRCRALVFLAQEAAPLPVEEKPVAAWKKWFAPMPVFATAFGGVLLVVVFFQMHRVANTPKNIVGVSPQEPLPLPLPTSEPPVASKNAPPKPLPRLLPSPKVRQATIVARTPPVVAAGALQQQTAIADKSVPTRENPSFGMSSSAQGYVRRHDNVQITQTQPTTLNGVVGRASAGMGTTVAAAPAMPSAPASSSQLDQLPAMKARNEAPLQIQTSEVASDAIEVSNAAVSNLTLQLDKTMGPLPSKLAVMRSVSLGDRVLAEDSDGALFLSKNSGRHWKTVKAEWQGKITQLATVPPPSSPVGIAARSRKTSSPVFQVTTAKGAVWISDDGLHWHLR